MGCPFCRSPLGCRNKKSRRFNAAIMWPFLVMSAPLLSPLVWHYVVAFTISSSLEWVPLPFSCLHTRILSLVFSCDSNKNECHATNTDIANLLHESLGSSGAPLAVFNLCVHPVCRQVGVTLKAHKFWKIAYFLVHIYQVWPLKTISAMAQTVPVLKNARSLNKTCYHRMDIT